MARDRSFSSSSRTFSRSIGFLGLTLLAIACSASGETRVGTTSAEISTGATPQGDPSGNYYTCVATGACTTAAAGASESACASTPGCEWGLAGNGCATCWVIPPGLSTCLIDAGPLVHDDDGGGCSIACPTSADTTATSCLGAGSACCWTSDSAPCSQTAACPTGNLVNPDACNANQACLAIEHFVLKCGPGTIDCGDHCQRAGTVCT